MTMMLSEPEQSNGDSELFHFTCCDINVAICGLDVSDHEIKVEPDENEETCAQCIYVDKHDLPCPVAGCPVDPDKGIYCNCLTCRMTGELENRTK